MTQSGFSFCFPAVGDSFSLEFFSLFFFVTSPSFSSVVFKQLLYLMVTPLLFSHLVPRSTDSSWERSDSRKMLNRVEFMSVHWTETEKNNFTCDISSHLLIHSLLLEEYYFGFKHRYEHSSHILSLCLNRIKRRETSIREGGGGVTLRPSPVYDM